MSNNREELEFDYKGLVEFIVNNMCLGNGESSSQTIDRLLDDMETGVANRRISYFKKEIFEENGFCFLCGNDLIHDKNNNTYCNKCNITYIE